MTRFLNANAGLCCHGERAGRYQGGMIVFAITIVVFLSSCIVLSLLWAAFKRYSRLETKEND